MPIVLEQLFRGVLCPALVCAVILAHGRLWKRRTAAAGAGTVDAAVATLCGYVVGHGLVVGWTFFSPVGRKDWLPLVCAMVTGTVLAEGARALHHAGARRTLKFVVSALSVWLVVRTTHGLVLAGLTLAVSGLWIAVEALARRRPGPGPATTSLIALVAASAVLVLSGSASFGQLVGVLAACAAVLGILAWRKPELQLLRGASGMVVVVPSVLWLNLYRTSFTEVPVSSALLVGAAMLSGWLAELGAVRTRGPRTKAAVYLVAALAPAALAVLIAWSVAEPAGDYDY